VHSHQEYQATLQPNETQPAIAPYSIPRSMQFALFITGLIWLLAARSAAERAAQGIAAHLSSSVLLSPLQEAFFLFLLLCGFATLSWIATRVGGIRHTNALPNRPTAGREWALGAAIGWAMLLIAVLPMAIAGDIHPTFWFAGRVWLLTLVALITLALNTLALEVGFRGYIYRRLIGAIGPTMATIVLSAIYAIFSSFRANSTSLSVFITFLLGILFSMAYLRTHGLWLGWGLHFAWDASMGILLGLPVADLISYNTIVDTNISGSRLLTGGHYGPEAAPFTIFCILAATAVLYRLTRDYAWQYTHPPIVSAGYPMDIAPPAAHTAMEKTAAPAPLVQILSTTAANASTSPEVEEHLRSIASIEQNRP
jgi:membrane protease YdiL (CAAX protease family)